MTGHTFSKHTLKKLGIENDNQCRTCNVQEDANHLLLHCTKYTNVQNKFLSLLKDSTLTEFLKSTYKDIINFINETKIDL